MLRPSIRNRTLLLVLCTLAIGLTLIARQSYSDARHEIEELFDAQLAQSARLLQGMLRSGMDATGLGELQAALDEAVRYRHDAELAGHAYESKLGFQAYDGRGRLILRSSSAPAQSLLELLGGVGEAQAGFHDLRLGDFQWRLFLLDDVGDGLRILVGERDDVRGELVGKIARRSLLPDLLGLPLVAVLVWLAVGWGLRPLARMAQLLRGRAADDLSPLLLAPLPQELEPVAASLNRLLHQLNQLMAREKRFIADAAHELRTPLAVLRIHAQNALAAADEAERERALGLLIGGVDRTTRVVGQLLTLARLEPEAQALQRRPVDLALLARETLAELTPLALSRDQELTLEADGAGEWRLTGDAAGLATLLQNLVGNALEYTPAGGRIQVSLRTLPDAVLLEVDDSGPGVPAEQRPQLLERFFRLGGGEGAGLGLAIVARIAELHGAELELLDSPLGGLRVAVRFPRGNAAAPSLSLG